MGNVVTWINDGLGYPMGQPATKQIAPHLDAKDARVCFHVNPSRQKRGMQISKQQQTTPDIYILTGVILVLLALCAICDYYCCYKSTSSGNKSDKKGNNKENNSGSGDKSVRDSKFERFSRLNSIFPPRISTKVLIRATRLVEVASAVARRVANRKGQTGTKTRATKRRAAVSAIRAVVPHLANRSCSHHSSIVDIILQTTTRTGPVGRREAEMRLLLVYRSQ